MERLCIIVTVLVLSVWSGTPILAAAPPEHERFGESCGNLCTQGHREKVQLALVFKDDDRRILNEQERRRFNSVGIIISSEGAMGSGAVVLQRDIVVTSAHLFFEDGRLHYPIDTYSFAISDGSGDWTRKKEYRIAEVRVGTKYVDNNIGRDWAVLRLRQEVDQAIQPLGIKTLAYGGVGASVQNVAFHRDLSNGGVPHITTCQFRKPEEGSSDQNETYDKPNVLIHDCDIIAGASGGPFIITERGQDHLVAINQGFFQAYSLPGKLPNVFLPGVIFNVAVAVNPEMIRSVQKLAESRRTVLGRPNARRGPAGPQQTSIKKAPAYPETRPIAERLRALQNLLEKGLITKEEAAAKRRQILKDL